MSSLDAYDTIPYARQALPETHPEQLAALARLYGVEGRDPGACRVLELGCAGGANLIPMAWFLRGSHFLGLDLSQTQVDAGCADIARLGLDNIEIRRADVAEVDLGSAGFDYIIAHGLYSWVPAPVRVALLRLVRRHLAPGGVAYLSFNALPGWHMRGMLREMLLFHVRATDGPPQRLAAARDFLGLLETGLGGLEALSAEYLRHELDALRSAPDSYLYHEYLASVNEPALFSDFVAAANAAGLRYLCNAELHYQFPGTLSEGVERAVAGIEDPVARQQYLDFLLNRNFHQALLVRDDAPATQTLDYERFAELALFADLRPPRRLELRRAKAQGFTDPLGQVHEVTHPLTKAALTYLAMVYPRAVAFEELAGVAWRQVAGSGDARLAEQTDHLFGELFQLFVYRLVGASPAPGGAPEGPREPPCATALARLEAGYGRLVDRRHASLRIDPPTAAAIAALDGTLDLPGLGAVMRAAGAAERDVDPAGLLRMLGRRSSLLG